MIPILQTVIPAPLDLTPSFDILSTSTMQTNPTKATETVIQVRLNATKAIPRNQISAYQSSTLSNASVTLAVDANGAITRAKTTDPTTTEWTTRNNNPLSRKDNKRHKYHYYFVASIATLSVSALIVNFVLMTKLCSCQGVPVITLFGISLMFFNMLLSIYGIALAAYLSQESFSWQKRFCQGFTSIKLFSLGSGVWTLIMLTFHYSINGAGGRDAEFKGIVYILEGVMLSGVFAIMAWIKLDPWCYLCSILFPETIVEWLLSGIEVWYYVIALLLLLRYPLYLYNHRRRDPEKKVKRKINKEHPIFIMILVSFIIWVCSYVLTVPHLGLFSREVSAVGRVCALMLVTLIQPLIYTIRNSCCCCTGNGSPCSSQRKRSVTEDVLLVCECSGSETCRACDSEFVPRVKYGDTKFTESRKKESPKSNEELYKNSKSKDPKVEKTQEIIKKNKKRKNKSGVALPKAVCRSPEIIRDTLQKRSSGTAKDETTREGEDVPLLEKTAPEEPNTNPKTPTKIERNKTPDESIPLLDDMDGGVKPPKAMPEMSPLKPGVKGQGIDSPSRNRQTEFPSFINIKGAVNTDDLPKEQKITIGLDPNKVNGKPVDVESRVSRGPTFYTIPEKNDNETKNQKEEVKNDRKEVNVLQEEEIMTVENDETIEQVKNNKAKENRKEKKKKKKKSKKKEKEEMKNTANISTESLEWDHAYSCSDSSNTGSLRDEHMLKDITEENTDSIAEHDTPQHAPGMEWDPSGCSMKNSPALRTKQETDPVTEWEPYMASESHTNPTVRTSPTAHLRSEVSFEDQPVHSVIDKESQMADENSPHSNGNEGVLKQEEKNGKDKISKGDDIHKDKKASKKAKKEKKNKEKKNKEGSGKKSNKMKNKEKTGDVIES